MNPYSVLNVRRTAKADAIKKAFRKAALRTHPDRGGSADDFDRVNLAYRVLSDPEAKAHYDATGEVRRPAQRSEIGPVMTVLARAFGSVMQELIQAGTMPSEKDLVDRMKQAIRTNSGNLDKTLAGMRQAEAALAEAVGRFTTDDEDNLLEEMVSAQLAGLRRQMEQVQRQRDVNGKAVGYLKRYKFKYKPAKAKKAYTTASTGYVSFSVV